MEDEARLNPAAALEDQHEAEVAADGKREVRYPFAFKSLDWDAYHLYRPVYPASLFSLWLDHHKSHGGRLDTAHDLGSGMFGPTWDARVDSCRLFD